MRVQRGVDGVQMSNRPHPLMMVIRYGNSELLPAGWELSDPWDCNTPLQ